MFKWIRNNLDKSAAAVVVQQLLEHNSAAFAVEGDPAITANRMIRDVWEARPHLFDGRFGQRPHKLSLAAAGLAHYVMDERISIELRTLYVACLSRLLAEVSANGNRYPFNGIDDELIATSTAAIMQFGERLSAIENEN